MPGIVVKHHKIMDGIKGPPTPHTAIMLPSRLTTLSFPVSLHPSRINVLLIRRPIAIKGNIAGQVANFQATCSGPVDTSSGGSPFTSDIPVSYCLFDTLHDLFMIIKCLFEAANPPKSSYPPLDSTCLYSIELFFI